VDKPQVSRELFAPLSAEARRALEELPAALDAALPLKAAHRRDLPDAVRELSARLTCERGGRDRPYWSGPRLASAYLRYFLPWNVLRLIRLLGGLDLPDPPTDGAQRTLLLDIGSGPLTLPLALWTAKPEWRDLPLDVACLDISPKAPAWGRAIFARLAGEKSPWRIVPLRAGAHEMLRTVRGRPWLISAVNVLNELQAGRASALAEQAAKLLRPQGMLLCVEPGTRLGAGLVQELRDASLALGLAPVSPCTHSRPCPLRGTRRWCHFSLDAEGAPAWLAQLTQEAGLAKQDLHLSFALLCKAVQHPETVDKPPSLGGCRQSEVSGRPDDLRGGGAKMPARVISAPFRVPGQEGLARYACSARGLLLLTRAADAPSGALVEIQWPEKPRRDEHSGAWIL
jgi:SAM-dependent methyltransferase